jgi:hypothetical protein
MFSNFPQNINFPKSLSCQHYSQMKENNNLQSRKQQGYFVIISTGPGDELADAFNNLATDK